MKLERSVMNWIKYSLIMKLKLVKKKINNQMTKIMKKKMIKDSVLQIVIITENQMKNQIRKMFLGLMMKMILII